MDKSSDFRLNRDSSLGNTNVRFSVNNHKHMVRTRVLIIDRKKTLKKNKLFKRRVTGI